MKFLYILLLMLGLTSCKNVIKGEGDVTEKDIPLSFMPTEIKLDGNFQAIYINDSVPRLKINAPLNLVNNLIIDSGDEYLNISEKTRVDANDIYKVYIYGQGVEEIRLYNNVSLDVSGGFKNEKMAITLNDNCNLNSQVLLNTLELEGNDNSKVTFVGNIIDLQLQLNDNATFICPKLVVSDADLNLRDNTESLLQITKTLKGKSTGNSVLEYIGDPDKDFQAKEQSKILKVENQ